MMNCNKALLPVARQLMMAPRRTFFSRRQWPPWIDVSRQIEDLDRAFSRMEREMNSSFGNFGRFGSPCKAQRFSEPSSSLINRFFPTIEVETKSGENGANKYVLKVDVGEGFNPENIKLSLNDRLLTIEAKIEQKSDDGNSRMYQEISKSFTLPENVKIDEIKSLFTPDGVLFIEAPLPEIESPQPKEIPISVESK